MAQSKIRHDQAPKRGSSIIHAALVDVAESLARQPQLS